MFNIFSIIVIIGGAIAIIVVSYLWAKEKLREQKKQEQEAMQQFQMEFEKEFNVALEGEEESPEKESAAELSTGLPPEKEKAPLQPAPTTPENATVKNTPVEEKIPEKPEPFMQPGAVKNLSEKEDPAKKIIRRLEEAGILTNREGPYFPLDPSGKCILVKLKKDKTALIVPRFESEHFITQALKRFDYVFLALHEGEPVILSKTGDYIATHFGL